MSGPTVMVQLDASGVAGLLLATRSIGQAAEEKSLDELAEQMRSMRLALTGALRAQGWEPVNGDQWIKRAPGRRR